MHSGPVNIWSGDASPLFSSFNRIAKPLAVYLPIPGLCHKKPCVSGKSLKEDAVVSKLPPSTGVNKVHDDMQDNLRLLFSDITGMGKTFQKTEKVLTELKRSASLSAECYLCAWKVLARHGRYHFCPSCQHDALAW